jgi:hypothetical protein
MSSERNKRRGGLKKVQKDILSNEEKDQGMPKEGNK